MKKGDLRRDSIIKAAERLFFSKGYDNTSVQDVLDALSISKGGFYHYFESKLSLLKAIARAHGEQRIEALRQEMAGGRLSPIRRINMLLSETVLFNHDDPNMNALIVKIGYIDGDSNLREETRTGMLPQLAEMMDRAVEDGVRDGSIFTRTPAQIGRILLLLGYDVNDEVCRMMAESPIDADWVIRAADLLNAYRECAENLIGARIGSIELYNLQALVNAFRRTAERINKIGG